MSTKPICPLGYVGMVVKPYSTWAWMIQEKEKERGREVKRTGKIGKNEHVWNKNYTNAST